jgi:hypothetical protein
MKRVPCPKSKFAPFEDRLLIDAVRMHGRSDWNLIATLIPGRNARQCRERWSNYVNPHITRATWTEADDRLLLEKFAELGSKWDLISRYFRGRGKNAIRNRFLTIQRHRRRDAMAAARGRPRPPPSVPPLPLREDIANITPHAEPPTQDPLSFLDAGFQNGAIIWQAEGDGDGAPHSYFF